jgi:hypothetical protein
MVENADLVEGAAPILGPMETHRATCSVGGSSSSSSNDTAAAGMQVGPRINLKMQHAGCNRMKPCTRLSYSLVKRICPIRTPKDYESLCVRESCVSVLLLLVDRVPAHLVL